MTPRRPHARRAVALVRVRPALDARWTAAALSVLAVLAALAALR